MESYLLLFASAFAAATLLPASSELVLAGLLAADKDPLALWAFATLGNTLGAAVNWALGRWFLRLGDRPWFPFKPDQLGRAQRWFQRYGVWTLLFAWAPVVGDAFTFIAGVMRVRFRLFLVLTALGKGARYGLVMGLVWGLDGWS